MTRLRGRWHPARSGDGGQITVFVVVMTVALTLAVRERAVDEAQQAARAGAQAINLATYRQNRTLVLDPAQAVADARRYLGATGYQGSVQVAGNVVTVEVTVTQQMQILDAAGLGSIIVHASASAIPERGITRVIP